VVQGQVARITAGLPPDVFPVQQAGGAGASSVLLSGILVLGG
jgi:hypothetical protein